MGSERWAIGYELWLQTLYCRLWIAGHGIYAMDFAVAKSYERTQPNEWNKEKKKKKRVM